MKEPKAARPSAGPALPRHLVAVDAGHHRGRLTGNVDEDRRRGAAVHRAVIDARHHDDGRRRRHREGGRQQQRHGGDRAQPGQHADQRADEDAEETGEQVEGLERDNDAVQDGGRRLHAAQNPHGPGGSRTPSQVLKSTWLATAAAADSVTTIVQRCRSTTRKSTSISRNVAATKPSGSRTTVNANSAPTTATSRRRAPGAAVGPAGAALAPSARTSRMAATPASAAATVSGKKPGPGAAMLPNGRRRPWTKAPAAPSSSSAADATSRIRGIVEGGSPGCQG